jgi:lipocalin
MFNCFANILRYRGAMMSVDWVPNRVEEDRSIDVPTGYRVNKMVLITVAKGCHQLFVVFVVVV